MYLAILSATQYPDFKKKVSLNLRAVAGLLFTAVSVTTLVGCAGNKTTPVATETVFHVYQDADFPDNHYRPTGFMGDIGDIEINEAFEGNPHSGKTSIQVVYKAGGKSPNSCNSSPPCKWAGVYWLHPLDNWGRYKALEGKGFDLSDYNSLVFWAKANNNSTIKFHVGGIDQPYGDSLAVARSIEATLSQKWQKFEIDLTGADLEHIIGGFAWVTTQDENPDGVTFQLDNIHFKRK